MKNCEKSFDHITFASLEKDFLFRASAAPFTSSFRPTAPPFTIFVTIELLPCSASFNSSAATKIVAVVGGTQAKVASLDTTEPDCSLDCFRNGAVADGNYGFGHF